MAEYHFPQQVVNSSDGESSNNSDSIPIGDFFWKILPPLGFNEEQVQQKIEIAKQLEAFNVRALKLIENKWEVYFGPVVGRTIMQALKPIDTPKSSITDMKKKSNTEYRCDTIVGKKLPYLRCCSQKVSCGRATNGWNASTWKKLIDRIKEKGWSFINLSTKEIVVGSTSHDLVSLAEMIIEIENDIPNSKAKATLTYSLSRECWMAFKKENLQTRVLSFEVERQNSENLNRSYGSSENDSALLGKRLRSETVAVDAMQIEPPPVAFPPYINVLEDLSELQAQMNKTNPKIFPLFIQALESRNPELFMQLLTLSHLNSEQSVGALNKTQNKASGITNNNA